MDLVTGPDGIARCWWSVEPDIYRRYHDEEWGLATTEDRDLFEKICLEGFQAGLSWLTILRKRDNFRSAFHDFSIEEIAGYGERDVARLLDDAGIVRHQGKIRSTINNARKAIELVEETGSLASYFWGWAPESDNAPIEIPAVTPESTAMSKDLKSRGWSFVGPTTIYAFMQAMGLVNDHLDGCVARGPSAASRRHVITRTL